MRSKTRLAQAFFLMLAVVALVSMSLLGFLWIRFEKSRSANESVKAAASYIEAVDKSMKTEADRVLDYLNSRKQLNEVNFLSSLKQQADLTFSLLNSIEKNNNSALDSEIKQLFISTLSDLSYKSSVDTYHIVDIYGNEVFNSSTSNLGNKVHSDKKFKNLIENLEFQDEGILKYDFSEGNSEKNISSFYKYYKPYNWIIAVSTNVDSYENNLQKSILKWLSAMPTDNYFVLMDTEGKILVNSGNLDNNNQMLAGTESSLKNLADEIVKNEEEKKGDFFNYNLTASQANNNKLLMRAHHRLVPEWGWIYYTWVYSSDINSKVLLKQQELEDGLKVQTRRIIILFLSMIIIIGVVSLIVSRIANRGFAAFFNFFEEATTTAVEMDPDEQSFEEFANLAEAANKMITQTKKAQQLLKASELKFKTIFDVSPQVITMSNLDGVLLDANEEYYRLVNFSKEEALGKGFGESFTANPKFLDRLFFDLKSERNIYGQEIVFINNKGDEFSLLTFGKKIIVEDESFVLIIFTDITDLKKSEEEKFILQEKLSRSTKMEAMGLMAAEVAHDLNNILSGIIGYPQLLLMEPNITEKQKIDLTEILNTGQKAAAVVSDLLTIARGVATSREVIPINGIVQQYISSPEHKKLEEFFPKINLITDLDKNAGNIIASPVHVMKIIMNLISNAFEAMPPEATDKYVVVKTQLVTLGTILENIGEVKAGEYVHITVKDNGSGIPKEDLDKIFEPFYSKKIKGRSGTGLGLAIVWNTVKESDGYIDVRSSAEGTIFNIYFPSTKSQVDPIKEKIDILEYRGNGEKVLIVDDIEIQRKLASRMLKTVGYEAVTAASGEEAVEFLRNENVDLIVLDMIMNPGMSGYDTYKTIMTFKPKQKAIIASGMAETEEVAKLQALGAGSFINKPYTLEDIALAVYETLYGDIEQKQKTKL